MEIPEAVATKILKKTNMKVGEDAAKEFALFLEELTADIASEASALAKKAGKKTVSAEDIKNVKKEIEEIKL